MSVITRAEPNSDSTADRQRDYRCAVATNYWI